MLTAYLDESGLDDKVVVVAGFLGNDSQWTQCAKAWDEGLRKHHKKHLHMKDLRFTHDSVRLLLETLGPIPDGCGLNALVAMTPVLYYSDLVVGTKAEKLTAGYYFGVMTIIDAVLKRTPKDESVKLVFEAQKEFEPNARMVFAAHKKELTATGEPKLSGIEFIPKDSSVLTEPADYLAFAMLQKYRNESSIKARWSRPILNNTLPAFGMIPDATEDREKWRTIIQTALRAHPQFAAGK
jgi:hypothetical protein